MAVGTLVCYKTYPGEAVDLSIGIIRDVLDETFLVEWDDGYITWYGAVALIKV